MKFHNTTAKNALTFVTLYDWCTFSLRKTTCISRWSNSMFRTLNFCYIEYQKFNIHHRCFNTWQNNVDITQTDLDNSEFSKTKHINSGDITESQQLIALKLDGTSLSQLIRNISCLPSVRLSFSQGLCKD